MDRIVSHETIRLDLKSIDDFTYRADRIFPMIDFKAEQRRVYWAKVFWLF